MKSIIKTAAAVGVTAMLVLGGGAHADQAVQTITAGCTTDATGWNGVRHACDSAPSVVRAPAGFVFVKDGAMGPKGPPGGKESANGSEHSCNFAWSDYVEVIAGTGIMQPQTFTLNAHARSPHGHASGRGWVKCRYDVTMTRYQSH